MLYVFSCMAMVSGSIAHGVQGFLGFDQHAAVLTRFHTIALGRMINARLLPTLKDLFSYTSFDDSMKGMNDAGHLSRR